MTNLALNIVIKTVNNEIYNLTVNRDARISEVKARLFDITSIAINRQRLIYRGRVLQDESVLQEYNIEDGHTVHMVARPVNFQELQQAQQSSTTTTGNTRAPVPPVAAALPTHRVTPTAGAGTASAEEANTMEHIRQSMLTLHTLISTMDTDVINRSYRQHYPTLVSLVEASDHTGTNGMLVDEEATNHAASSATGAANRATAGVEPAAQRRFFVGQWVDVKDTVQQWLEATVMNINPEQTMVFIHYNGWPDRWDEWIAFDSPRIAPFRSRTIHTTLTPYMSPTPNVSLARAPITGANDLRTLLPEVARMFRVLQPAIESAAALVEESLQDRPTVSAYTTGRQANLGAPNDGAASTGPYRRNRSADAAERTGPMLSTGPPSSPLQSSRIAPGMPWEHAGTRHLERNSLPVGRPPAREASSSSTSHHTVTSPSNATAGAATAGSPYDRRQRLRYADYDPTSPPASPGLSATQPAPRFFNSESSHSSESIMDFAHMSDSARGSEDFTSYNQSNRSSGNELTRERDGVPTRKRSAQAAEYEADDSRFPVSEEEGNAKVSAMEESKEQVEMAPPETEAQRVQRIEERERRLRSLVQALCPLIDRFGRVLTDISPHMWEMGDLDSGAPASTAPAADNNPYHFETSLLNLLRDRPPSPPPRRAYRTPIAMQTRIGGSVGSAGMGTLGLGLLGAPGVRTGNLAFLSDLLGGDPMPPRGAANAGTVAGPGARHVDVHIAFVQPPNAARPTGEQERAAMLSSTILQAQMAQNLSARAQLLSNRTQELNNYSVAIEEMLRSLTGADGSGASAAGATSSAQRSGPGSSPRQATATSSTRTRRQFASSIAPGPLSRSTVRPSDYLVSPVLSQRMQTAGAPATGGAESVTAMDTTLYDREEEGVNSGNEEGEEMSQEEEEEDQVDEESEPLDDLLPNLSFNELGQSLMDLRAAREGYYTQQYREQQDAAEVEPFRGSWPDGSSSPTTSFRSRSRNASAASADRTHSSNSPVSSSSRQHSSASAHEEVTSAVQPGVRNTGVGAPALGAAASTASTGSSSSRPSSRRATVAADEPEPPPRTMYERLRRSFSFIP